MISRSGEDVVKEVSSRLLMRSFMIESVIKEVSYHLLVLTSSIARRFMQFWKFYTGGLVVVAGRATELVKDIVV